MIKLNNPVVGNLAEFRKNGYLLGDRTKQRGYISRVIKPNADRPVYVVTSGKRKGQLFFLQPSYRSRSYCFRIYLTK